MLNLDPVLPQAAIPGTATTTPAPPRDDYLDALRGMAILGVVAVHIGFAVRDLPTIWQKFLVHGQLGVQLFFMVSAYTLCQSSDRSGGPDRFDASRFFVRRFFRIVPAYWLAIAVYLALAVYSGLPDDWRSRSAASFLFANYLRPEWVNSGLPPGGWSIVAEVFFYLLFPLLYLQVTTAPRAVLALAFSAGLGLYLSHRFPGQASFLPGFAARIVAGAGSYFGIANQLQVFCCGFLAIRTIEPRSFHRIGSLLVVALLILSSLVKLVPDTLQLLYFGILFALLLKTLKHNALPIFVNAPMVKMGEISFSIYLVHFAVIRLLAGVWPLPRSGLGSLCLFAPLVLVLSILLAGLSYRYVEKPFISLGRRLTRSAAGYPVVRV